MAPARQTASHVSTPIKRIRWATQRAPGQHGRRKRDLIKEHLHRRSLSTADRRESAGMESVETADDGPRSSQGRRLIYFNLPLPEHATDDDGRPTAHFERNKVRTSKYTPISFIPKNLYFQFHNIANIYFLFIIILSFFPIFGASNPGLLAVPLIVIVFITAVKDAIEDYRRTVLDNELNNSPVHRLLGWTNVNSREDRVSVWRRIKKASSQALRWIARLWKSRKAVKGRGDKSDPDRALDYSRPSLETGGTPRTSMYSIRSTRSRQGPEAIPMTDVNPTPARHLSPADAILHGHDRPTTAFSYEGDAAAMNTGEERLVGADAQPRGSMVPVRTYGSLIDPRKPADGEARFKRDRWKNVQVGDFVRIFNDDQVPADVVILSTSDPDGACYIETKNLDGETNLKVRQALHCGRMVKHARDCQRTAFSIESEPPQANLYQYSGAISWEQVDARNPDAPPQQKKEPITIQNLVLRGCSLRNTEWVLGVVIFAGRETKIMLNAGDTPSKRSRLARELNWNVIYNFIILFIMCLISGIVQGVTWAHGHNSLDYFEFGSIAGKPPLDGLVTFWTALILFQNLVPISLYITIEIIKTAQVFFIYSDVHMYYEKLDYPCTPKSWNISDDVGQIEYIFSDKTGTLTQNVMEFKKCTINGVPYGEAYTEAQAGMQRRQGIDVEEEGRKATEQIARDRVQMLDRIRRLHSNPYLHDEDVTFVAPDYIADLSGESGDEQREANRQFMLALALCHTVISERTPGDAPRIEFKAQSPDEAALVATARDCGFTFLGRTHDSMIVNVLGQEKKYEILNTLEFNSTRKRMSAILRMPDDHRIVLFCKGADSVIYSRLKGGEQSELRHATAEHLEMFAREGLRTLCVAQRVLGEEEYRAWNEEHDLAAAAVEDREEKLERVADAIERELTLLGGTAIEDRLQDGVPDTIALLGEAGIKLWVLTGDKVETAINIGFSCNLLSNEMDLIVMNFDDGKSETAMAALDRYLAQFNMTGSNVELAAARKNHEAPGPRHALIIDGDSLRLVLEVELRQKFLLLCKQCKSVLCCRVSPAQKADVVRMVKTGLDVMTLAVGDGANDVAMIQEADVGVGIAGEEGRQAVMSSDYAIGQFRFLQRLVLVHGRWSYRRLAETIANFFYKNMIWVFALFWYQIYTNFDGTYLYDYTYILLFNLAFTSLPVILMGILDQDVSDKVSLAVPQLYRRGIERKEWTPLKFWGYMLDGVYQSVICFYLVYLLFAPAVLATSSGQSVDDPTLLGVYVGCAAIVVINLYFLMNIYRWDWLVLLIIAISILLIWIWTGLFSLSTYSAQFYKAGTHVFGQLSFWAVCLLIVIASLLPRFAIKSFQKIFRPYDVDIIREQVRQGKFAHLDEPSDHDLAPVEAPSEKASAQSKSPRRKSPPQKSPPRSHNPQLSEDRRPIYPPSVTATATTNDPRSHNGSDGTDYTGHRESMERMAADRPNRPSLDRPRPSFDRMRSSMDRTRASFEASSDFTSAALLSRIESSHCRGRSRLTDDFSTDKA